MQDQCILIIKSIILSFDAHCNFIAIDVGDYGRNSDGGVFASSSFGHSLINNLLDLPDNKSLNEQGIVLPHVFIADEAYPLRYNLMRPYPFRSLDSNKKIFNDRLSTARKTVECAFGIITKKWEFLQRPSNFKPENTVTIIKAICVLHNFTRQNENFQPIDETVIDFSQITTSNHSSNNQRPTTAAYNVREEFKNYFNN